MNRNNTLLVCSVWGMELAWMYASAAFVMMAAFSRPFPFFEGIAASGSAMVLTFLTQSSGWRRIQQIGIHLVGFAIVSLRLVYVYENPIHSFFSRYWIVEFLNQPKSVLQWFFL